MPPLEPVVVVLVPFLIAPPVELGGAYWLADAPPVVAKSSVPSWVTPPHPAVTGPHSRSHSAPLALIDREKQDLESVLEVSSA